MKTVNKNPFLKQKKKNSVFPPLGVIPFLRIFDMKEMCIVRKFYSDGNKI